MTKAYQKEVNISDSTTSLDFGVTEVSHDFKNNLTITAIAAETPGEKQTVLQNLNRIKEKFTLTCRIDDDVAALNANVSDKEDFKDKMISIASSQEILDLTIGANDNYSGYIEQIQVSEKANEDSTVYRIKLKFAVGEDIEAADI